MPRYRFAEFVLDVEENRLVRNGEELRLRGKVFDTLSVLVQNAGKLVRKDELLAKVWPNTVVEENNLDHCISQLRKVLGGSANEYIETVPRRGYRFRCPVQPEEEHAVPKAAGGMPAFPAQEIRRFRASDGTSIAYSRCGSGPPLIKAANWLNHLEFEWHSPIWAHWVAELAKHHTLFRYDERGNGLSDWNVEDFSFGAWVRDFEQLVDEVKLKKFAVLGISQGAAVAIAYAAAHPERVSQLILYGGFSRGISVRKVPAEMERFHALMTLVRLGWGKGNPVFRQMWTTLFMPDATPEQADWFNELQRVTTSPENAVQLLDEIGKINVVDQLPKIQCPTLVVHSRRDAVIPISEGRVLAARIPGAKLVELPSRNHIVIPQEPAYREFLQAIGDFLGWSQGSAAKVAK